MIPKTQLLSLRETAALHDVDVEDLKDAVQEGRPVEDMNLDRYAVERNEEIRFSFPSWYSFPSEVEGRGAEVRDEQATRTIAEETKTRKNKPQETNPDESAAENESEGGWGTVAGLFGLVLGLKALENASKNQ